MAKQITDPFTNNVDSPPAIPQNLSDKPLTDERPPSSKSQNQNLASGLFSKHENDAKSEVSSVDAPSPAALADLPTTLPGSDRAELIADMPLEQRGQVAQLLATRITEDSTHE